MWVSHGSEALTDTIFFYILSDRSFVYKTVDFEPLHMKTKNSGSDHVRHKPSCTVTQDGKRLEIFRNCTIRVAKTKALICTFVFAYADCWYSHAAAHLILTLHFVIPSKALEAFHRPLW